MGYLIGALYFYLWYTSILAGYICLYCPLLPVLLISNKMYRYCTDTILTFWQQYPTVLVEILSGTEIIVTGDPVIADEMSILIMNHRTRTDWNFLWPSLYHCTRGKNTYRHSTKFLLKDVIRHVPGAGWVMQLTFWIFIKRKWVSDKKTLETLCNYIEGISYKFSILLFPEGTDLTEETKRKSDSFARKNELQEYEYVLHPKTTGFAYLSNQLLQRDFLDAVYDLTIIYPDETPQTEKNLIQGKFPRQVKLHVVRYPVSVLPKSEDDLKTFLKDIWNQKEINLKEYYRNNIPLNGTIMKRSGVQLFLALIFWTILPYFALYILMNNNFFRIIIFTHTLFLLVINMFTEGFPSIEITLYNLKKKLLGPKFAF